MHGAFIKNLSIALEALSRMPGTEKLSGRIKDILSDAIYQEEIAPSYKPPVIHSTSSDDEIHS